jgi:peptidoglycan/LPS O-acetylase OafA/YrhL
MRSHRADASARQRAARAAHRPRPINVTVQTPTLNCPGPITPSPGRVTAATNPSFRLGHRPCLDGVRALAVLSVLFAHLLTPLLTVGSPLPRGGGYGVDIFFVLSGFLITTLLIEEYQTTGTIRLGLFFARRALRLLPALLTFLVIAVLLTAFVDRVPPRLQREGIAASLLALQNWWFLTGHSAPALRHMWSLAIEDQFYLLWPLALLTLLRRGLSHRRLVPIVLLGALASAALRLILSNGGASSDRLKMGTDTRAEGLLLGCALGLLATADLLPKSEWARRMLGVIAAVAGLGLAWTVVCGSPFPRQPHGYLPELTLTVIAVATTVVLAYLLVEPHGKAARVLGSPILAGTGRVSYGIYLWHYFLLVYCWQLFPDSLLTGSVLALALTYPIVTMSYYGIERPCLRLKAHFASTRSSTTRLTANDGRDATPTPLVSLIPPYAARPFVAMAILAATTVPALLGWAMWGAPAISRTAFQTFATGVPPTHVVLRDDTGRAVGMASYGAPQMGMSTLISASWGSNPGSMVSTSTPRASATLQARSPSSRVGATTTRQTRSMVDRRSPMEQPPSELAMLGISGTSQSGSTVEGDSRLPRAELRWPPFTISTAAR